MDGWTEAPAETPVPTPGPGVRVFDEPLVRVVGADIDAVFLHGTRRANIRTLGAAVRPRGAGKSATGSVLDHMAGVEENEFGAALYLSEPRQAHQAVQFANRRGCALAVVTLREGTRLLDLADEAARARPWGGVGGGPEVLRFFNRPAIADGFSEWYLDRVNPGYKASRADWRERVMARFDPASPDFDVRTWQDCLLPYAADMGWGGVRFADEVLLADRGAVERVRPATAAERGAAEKARAWPGGKGASLYVDRPVGARAEALRRRDAPDRHEAPARLASVRAR